MSVSGGLTNAFVNAQEIGADTLMFYTKSNRRWQAKPISEKDAQAFKETAAEYAATIYPNVVHANYLMNLGSPEEDKWEKSYHSLVDEINRVAQVGLKLMVMHPGSHMKTGEETGLAKIAQGIRRALAETADSAPEVVICLETMAGQGTNLGYKFEHLAYLIEHIEGGPRVGVCFDTCHVFTAGYDIRTQEAYDATMAEFDRVIGLDHIKCFHFNDSKYDLGTRRDRHEHIGKGFIGSEGFACFVNDPRWADHPAHLETPKTEEDDEGNKTEMDPVNLATLRELIK
ncbi:MAG: deoxyribonuclease IV [Ardenticatenaceae bacterium]|nr:deoxyribonuclease IV [Ardenticatenaceae bacterium]